MNAASLRIDKTRGTRTSGNTRVVVDKVTRRTVVTLHETDIAVIDYEAGTVLFNTEGWNTPTTESGINQVLSELKLAWPLRVAMKRIPGAEGYYKEHFVNGHYWVNHVKTYPRTPWYNGVEVGDTFLIALDGTLLNCDAWNKVAVA